MQTRDSVLVIIYWFFPLLKKIFPEMNVFEVFIEELASYFGEIDKQRLGKSRLRNMKKGSCPTFMYASDFVQHSCVP
mgnify:CR=1 FL=1